MPSFLMDLPNLNTCTVAVIGLGYVGLPLAVELGKPQKSKHNQKPLKRKVIGFDIDPRRLSELKDGFDRTKEINSKEIKESSFLEFTANKDLLKEADVFLITVPTPIDDAKRPHLIPLEKASCTVGQALKDRSIHQLDLPKKNRSAPIVIFESTVYPGATEEVCVPIIENESQLTLNSMKENDGFFCGYSPERINPGDCNHRLVNIKKVTSGSNEISALWIDNFYASVITAGTHLAPSIKVAEAAKVIENTQRDLNIALVNELAIIFNRLQIDTLDVLEAAGTKWNFLPFRPGLVGGHCIGVDPYYLTFKAEQLGYHPQVVLAGRRINDGMGDWVVEKLVLAMAKKGLLIGGAKVLVLGITFKENCPDLRNTKVVDLLISLKRYGMETTVVDPWVEEKESKKELGIEVLNNIPKGKSYAAVIGAVAHNQFIQMSNSHWQNLLIKNGILLDLKGIMKRELNALRL